METDHYIFETTATITIFAYNVVFVNRCNHLLSFGLHRFRIFEACGNSAFLTGSFSAIARNIHTFSIKARLLIMFQISKKYVMKFFLYQRGFPFFSHNMGLWRTNWLFKGSSSHGILDNNSEHVAHAWRKKKVFSANWITGRSLLIVNLNVTYALIREFPSNAA